tara:strand:- start:229 stop:420 length:192 start_codon:yes stop_codon:yes gene_type:complete
VSAQLSQVDLTGLPLPDPQAEEYDDDDDDDDWTDEEEVPYDDDSDWSDTDDTQGPIAPNLLNR